MSQEKIVLLSPSHSVGLLERWYQLDAEKIKIPESCIKDRKTNEEGHAEPVENTKDPIPISGSILIGNQNLDTIDLKWVRSILFIVCYFV